MKWGLLAYSTNTGLGNQTYNLYKFLQPNKVMLVDLSSLNGVKTHHERYDNYQLVNGIPNKNDINIFLEGLDLIFVCETPLNYYLFERARELGVKIILQPNWEFYDYNNQPNLPKPDLLAIPSLWHFEGYQGDRLYLPVPIDTEKLERNEVTKFRRFLHPSNRPAIHDRNGTIATIEAFLKTPMKDATLTISTQDKRQAEELREKYRDSRIIIDDTNYEKYEDVYKNQDCVILPRKYGGLCLPLNESLACGLPVIMTDIEPNNLLLPELWLVHSDKVDEFMTRSMIDIYEPRQMILVNRLLDFYLADEETVKLWSDTAYDIAQSISWENMKDKYLATMEALCKLA
jgi:glycosyltransferase involved in cell wall biosynthesis